MATRRQSGRSVGRVPAAARREQLVHAAVEVIAEHGIGGATTRRIAAAAGAPLSTLHQCFENKEALFWAIYEHQLDRLSTMSFRLPEDQTPGHVAASVLRQIMEVWLQDATFARAQAALYFWILRHDRDLAVKVCRTHVELNAAAIRGACDTDEDPALIESMAKAVAAAADGLLQQWLAEQDDAAILDSAAFIGAAFDGVSARAARR